MGFTLPDIEATELPPIGIKPRVFISYSRANLAQVATIVQLLEDAYFDAWFDKRDIPGGEDWKREIAKGIQSAQRILFFMSPESCASDYCQGEIHHALKHHIHVIPIRINSKMPADALAQMGLADKQFIDWADADNQRNWKRLLDDHSMINPPLPRDIRRLEVEYSRLHRRYLNVFFRPEFSRVSLSDIADDAPVRGVPLTSIYVPLPVDMSVTIRVDEQDKKTITDWWVAVERSETRADENIPDELRGRKLRDWNSLKANDSDLQVLIADIERQLAERAEMKQDSFKSEQNWYMEAHDAANIQHRMVLTGIPGSGKSTFLKHLALCLAGDLLKDKEGINRRTLGLWTLPAYTPVFIRLADLVRQEFPNRGDQADTEDFDLYVKKQLEQWHIPEYWRDLQDQLYDGSAIILLDGLDEVPNAVEQWRRDQITDFVAAVVNEYGKCRMIITSRPYAYDGTWKLDGFGQTTLIPLHDHRVFELAKALFGQLPQIPDPATEAEAFFKAIQKSGGEKFWHNPLQFTMGATLWVRNADKPITERIPPTSALLYDKSVELMLEKWAKHDAAFGASVAELLKVSTAQLRSALERLALHMQTEYGSDRRATFKQWLLIEYLDDCVQEQKGVPRQSIDYHRALDLLEQRAGLLASEEARLYRFQHLSYQEYLAACELAKPSYFPHAVGEKILAQPGRWRNVVPLLVDIVTQRSERDLQALGRALLPTQDSASLPNVHPLWESVAYTARLHTSHTQMFNAQEQHSLRVHLVNLLENSGLAPVERAEMGRILSHLGDPRLGVGTLTTTIAGKSVELPEFAWCAVPAPPNHKVMLGAEDQSDNPRREVAFDYSFKMAKYLVTYQQFQTFIDSGEYDHQEWWRDFPAEYQPQPIREQRTRHANHPRDNVSWYQAVAFTRWLTAKYQVAGLLADGVEIRLPTEQEWEYAASGTDERKYPYPGDFDATRSNFSETGIGQTSAVGLFANGASPFGIFDMSGNLWEWCLNDYRHPQVLSGYSNGEIKVLRGGSFHDFRRHAAASFRSNLYAPNHDYHNFGLRLVVSVPIALLSRTASLISG